MKPDLSGGKSNSIRGVKDCCGRADADRNSSPKSQAYVESRMQLETARTGSEGGIRLTQQWATGPYLTKQASNKLMEEFIEDRQKHLALMSSSEGKYPLAEIVSWFARSSCVTC